MRLWKAIRSDYNLLRDGPPGHRFRSYVEYRRTRRGSGISVARVVNLMSGAGLIVFGLAIGWLPGPGGFLAVIGLALLALEIPWLATVMDSGERAVRRLWHSARGRPPASGAGD
ncbi:PGPGW domain-containing protein [Roseimaritima ulvae]|uniref:Transmembrane protein (PGPGW) n=1 Tax=Roseimaritima ulvae TaxID=980254 RepID=A0A5B9QSE6_9BACT|nr:PGPGW domain-containing protein [Roseimaritima ulvae]QEG42037.1 Putative transmembrane protein (PGPGW) [Roseimaritima ulvae]